MYYATGIPGIVRRRVNNLFWEVAPPCHWLAFFTRNPERTADLSGQLRQQGYSVEVARPDQTNLAPADLEIEFEVCERADVLNRAADLAAELDADVAVVPVFCRCLQRRQ